MKKYSALIFSAALLFGTIAFTSCNDKKEEIDNDKELDFRPTGIGSGTGLNSDYDNNSTTGAIDPGQAQYERRHQSGDDSASGTTGNTGTRVSPFGGVPEEDKSSSRQSSLAPVGTNHPTK